MFTRIRFVENITIVLQRFSSIIISKALLLLTSNQNFNKMLLITLTTIPVHLLHTTTHIQDSFFYC